MTDDGWYAIDSAPARRKLILWLAEGGVTLGVKDGVGQWRRINGRPFNSAPTAWRFPPGKPSRILAAPPAVEEAA